VAAVPVRRKEQAMYLHELLMKARQEDLLRALAQRRLAAEARRARPTGAVRLPWLDLGRPRLLMTWAGERSAVAARCRAWPPEGGSR
jgi:hypothetical protein